MICYPWFNLFLWLKVLTMLLRLSKKCIGSSRQVFHSAIIDTLVIRLRPLPLQAPFLFSSLTLWAAISKNGQRRSNNSSAICLQIFWVCLTILWHWRLKDLDSKSSKVSHEVRIAFLQIINTPVIRLHPFPRLLILYYKLYFFFKVPTRCCK